MSRGSGFLAYGNNPLDAWPFQSVSEPQTFAYPWPSVNQGGAMVGQRGRAGDYSAPPLDIPQNGVGLAIVAMGTLAVVGGAGALVGYLVGGTKVAALTGALVALAAPPVLSAFVPR